MNIEPTKVQCIKDFLLNTDQVKSLTRLHDGPIHCIFPQLMAHTIQRFKELWEKYDIDLSIYFAHKANQSDSFLRMAHYCWIWVEVSSYYELQHALSSWFNSSRILAWWIKNQEYILLSLQHTIPFVIDNPSELRQIITLQEQHFPHQYIELFLRISDPYRQSKFWVCIDMLTTHYGFIANHAIKILWLHYHWAETSDRIKSDLIQKIMNEYTHNTLLTDSMSINIWWWWWCKKHNHCSAKNYVKTLSQKVIHWEDTETWWNYAFNIHRHHDGSLIWKDKLQQMVLIQDCVDYFDKVLSQSIARRMSDAMMNTIIEPWSWLLQNAWITILKIIGIKEDNFWNSIIIVNANINNVWMVQYFADPELIKVEENNNKQNWSQSSTWYFITWNLCRPDDILMMRKVHFHQHPEIWDFICLRNTAAYISDFNDARSHLHPLWKKYSIICHSNNQFEIYKDSQYNPYLHNSPQLWSSQISINSSEIHHCSC